MPFCPSCGAQIKETDSFCGKCGTKITKKKDTIDITSNIINFDNENIKQYSKLLSWVLDKHIKVLIDITQELIPYFDSLIIFEENNIVSVGNTWFVAESSPELLLYRIPLAAKTDHVYTLDNLAKYTELEISEETRTNLSEKFRSMVEVYQETTAAMEAIYEITKPISDYKKNIDKIFKEEDLKNVNAIEKLDIYLNKFIENIKKFDWSKYPSGNLDEWIKKAEEHGLNAGIFEDEVSKIACPYSNDLGIDTDIERCMISYFSCIPTLQDAFNECREAFIECSNKKGLFGGIPGNIKTKAIEKLTYLDLHVNALYYPYDYCNDKSAFFESNLKQFLIESGSVIEIQDEITMKNIFNIISMLNGMYPVNLKWGPVIFEQ